MQHHFRPKIVSSSWSFWVYQSSRYDLLNVFFHISLTVCRCFILCMLFLFISASFSRSCAPGSRGCWGSVCMAGETGHCGCRGIRGHGHTAIWSQYSNSPAKCQEGQARTAFLRFLWLMYLSIPQNLWCLRLKRTSILYSGFSTDSRLKRPHCSTQWLSLLFELWSD